MKAIVAGNATKDEKNGADFWIKYYEELPDYYISEQEIRDLGWKRGKSPKKFAPGKMVTRGIYQNRRVWYEADINYYEGKRNKHRLLWSNNGLIFVTYDHYEKFYKVIREENSYGIRKSFNFPEWYEKNWDAFCDLLWSECDADKVEVFGEHTLNSQFDKYLKTIHEILDDMVKTCAKWGKLFEYEIIN